MTLVALRLEDVSIVLLAAGTGSSSATTTRAARCSTTWAAIRERRETWRAARLVSGRSWPRLSTGCEFLRPVGFEDELEILRNYAARTLRDRGVSATRAEDDPGTGKEDPS